MMHCYLCKMLPRTYRTRTKGGTLVTRKRLSLHWCKCSNQPSPNPRIITKYLKHPLLHHGKHISSPSQRPVRQCCSQKQSPCNLRLSWRTWITLWGNIKSYLMLKLAIQKGQVQIEFRRKARWGTTFPCIIYKYTINMNRILEYVL
jgi:hypothetical protein